MPLSAERSAAEAEGLSYDWTSVRVEEVGEVRLGRQRSPRHHIGPNLRPYLRVANVLENRIDISDVMTMNFTDDEFERYRLREGDILLNEGQSLELVGRPAMFRGEIEDVCFTNTLIRFRAGPAILPEYALIVFRHYLRSGRFRRIAKITTNLAHLGAERFSKLFIPLPPIAEQRAIVRRSQNALSVLAGAATRIAKLQMMGKKFSCGLEAAALSGRLTDQRPHTEPKPKFERKRRERVPGLAKKATAHETARFDQYGSKQREALTMRKIIPVIQALQTAERPVGAQQLFSAAGYPDDAPVAQVEQFYVDLRQAMRCGEAPAPAAAADHLMVCSASQS